MPVKKKVTTPARKAGAAVAKVGKAVIIDGHEYDIVAMDEKRNVFEFARTKGGKEGSTTWRRGLGNISDITQAPEGFLYLPNRVTPKLERLIQRAVERGTIESTQSATVMAAVRNHPMYVDRDDIAVKQVGEMYGIDLLATEE